MTNRNLAGKDVTGVPPASMTVLLDSIQVVTAGLLFAKPKPT